MRRKPFGRLLTAYTVNQIGDYVGLVALGILVYAETRDPLAVTALYVAMQFLPALIAPLLTARLDQRSLRSTLAALYLVEGLLFAALGLLATNFLLTVTLVLVLIDGALMLTARGLLRAATSDVLEPAGLLRRGNGLLNVGFALGFVGGAALGGVLVETFSVETALFIDAASFSICAVLLAASSGITETKHVQRVPLQQRLMEGLGYVRNNTPIRLLLIGEGLAIVCFTLVVPIEIVYAKETLQTNDAGYGSLIAAWGFGVVLGSALFLGTTKRSPQRLILLSTISIGIAYIGIGSVRTLWAACLFSILGGAGNGVQWVSVMTALQEATPPELQARITGLLEAVASAATGVGFIVGGLLTSVTSPVVAFTASGIAVLALCVAAALVRAFAPTPATETSG